MIPGLERARVRVVRKLEAKPPEVRRWWVLWTVMLGSMIAQLDATIVNVSIPAVMRDFHSSVNQVQWVISAYMIAFAVLMPLTGWVREQIGARNLYLACLSVFTLGSLLCGLAWNLESLIFFRVIQALGGGAMTPIAMSILTETFPAHEKGKALGIWGAGVLLGPIFGPPLGGFLTEFSGWRSIFLVNLPIGFIGIAAAFLILRRDRKTTGALRFAWRSFDFVGFSLLSGFLISLLYGASTVEQGGIASRTVFLCGILSLVFLGSFLVSELRSKNQVLDFSLFRSKTFSIALAVTIVRSFALYGGQFLLPLFLSRVQNYSEYQIGLMILPGAVLIGLLFPFAGKYSDRFGSKPFVVVGLAILVIFFYGMTRVSDTSSMWGIQIPILVRGLGLGLLVTPLTSLALSAAPAGKSGNASILLVLSQQLGGSLGIASLGSILELHHRIYVSEGLPTGAALVKSFQDAFTLGVVVCALAWLLATALPKRFEGNSHGTA